MNNDSLDGMKLVPKDALVIEPNINLLKLAKRYKYSKRSGYFGGVSFPAGSVFDVEITKIFDAIEKAIPLPDEPFGLGAVVRASYSDGKALFVRVSGENLPWKIHNGKGHYDWDNLRDVVILSEGFSE
jgi:hypothetical protein